MKLIAQLLILVSFSLVASTASAVIDPPACPPDSNKGVFAKGLDKVRLQKARNMFLENNIAGALEEYKEFYQKDKDNGLVNFRIGECLVSLRRYREAIPYLEKAIRNTPEVDPELYLNAGKAYHRLDDLETAQTYYAEYRQRLKRGDKFGFRQANKAIREARFAKKMQSTPVPAKVENMGEEINSEFVDSNPCPAPDGKSLWFTTRRPENKGGQMDGSGQYYEDVWVAQWDSVNAKWLAAEPAEGRINTPDYDASLSFSADGKEFYMYRNLGENGSGEIFKSKLSKSGKWGSPKSLGKPINSTYFETSACVTADDKTMFFISERKGGQGQADIWMAERISRSTWGEPVNLGPVINSELDEISVWCNADGTVLFFSSDGHLGMGGYDIYKSTKVGGMWTAPVNVGYPINTVMDERQFVITTDHKMAYYITQPQGGFGSYDIQEVDLSQYDVVNKDRGYWTLAHISGKVLNNTAGEVVGATVTFIDPDTNEKVAETTSGKNGAYEISVPGETTYTVKVVAKGFTTREEAMDTPLEREGKTSIAQDFVLK